MVGVQCKVAGCRMQKVFDGDCGSSRYREMENIV